MQGLQQQELSQCPLRILAAATVSSKVCSIQHFILYLASMIMLLSRFFKQAYYLCVSTSNGESSSSTVLVCMMSAMMGCTASDVHACCVQDIEEQLLWHTSNIYECTA